MLGAFHKSVQHTLLGGAGAFGDTAHCSALRVTLSVLVDVLYLYGHGNKKHKALKPLRRPPHLPKPQLAPEQLPISALRHTMLVGDAAKKECRDPPASHGTTAQILCVSFC